MSTVEFASVAPVASEISTSADRATRDGAGLLVQSGPLRVVAVSLSPRQGASQAACEVAAVILTRLGVDVSVISTSDLPFAPAGMDSVDGFSYPDGVLSLIRELSNADAVILGAPVHRSAVAGIARNWVEVLHAGLMGKAVLPVVAAGSPRAHLAAEAFRSDLWQNFDAFPLPPVLITDDGPDTRARLTRAVAELVAAIPSRRTNATHLLAVKNVAVR